MSRKVFVSELNKSKFNPLRAGINPLSAKLFDKCSRGAYALRA
jgi:hypothetical protein